MVITSTYLKTNVWKNKVSESPQWKCVSPIYLLFCFVFLSIAVTPMFLFTLYFFPHLSCCLFSLPSPPFSTFNPADYSANSGGRHETWEGDGNEPAEGTGTENNNKRCHVLMPISFLCFRMIRLLAFKYRHHLVFTYPKLVNWTALLSVRFRLTGMR